MASAPYERDKLRWIYARMTLIREFEDRVQQDLLAGRITGAVHLYAGEESVAVGICLHLRQDDYIVSTHRPHGHCLAKGLPARSLMAELHGKSTGICRGKGGSMHIGDLSLGILGANGIVGAGAPLACGAALRTCVAKTDQVTVCFLGDGATNTGAFHESLNLAAVLKLPVIFVIENNGYADATHIRYAAAIENLADRAAAYGMPGTSIDGTDVLAVAASAGEAIATTRAQRSPCLIEYKTYRYYGHCYGEPEGYRSAEEMESAKARDCIQRFARQAIAAGWLSQQEIDEILRQSVETVQEALAFAESSPLPRPEECLEDLYVS